MVGLHLFLNLLEVETEAERTEAAISSHLITVGRHTRHPHRRMRFLDWFGHHPPWRDFHQLAIVLEDFIGPGLDDNIQRLAHFLAGTVVVDAKAVELLGGSGAPGA